MMKLINLGETFSVTMLTGIVVLALSNCEQGPADRVGRNIDDPSDTIADQIERTGNHIKVMAEPDEQEPSASNAYF